MEHLYRIKTYTHSGEFTSFDHVYMATSEQHAVERMLKQYPEQKSADIKVEQLKSDTLSFDELSLLCRCGCIH